MSQNGAFDAEINPRIEAVSQAMITRLDVVIHAELKASLRRRYRSVLLLQYRHASI